jgi:hypothetical protein
VCACVWGGVELMQRGAAIEPGGGVEAECKTNIKLTHRKWAFQI